MANREQKRWQHHEAAKQIREVRKQIKRNRDDKPPRSRDWHPGNLDDPEAVEELELALPQVERVMPVGEQERRRVTLTKALTTRPDLIDESDVEDTSVDQSGTVSGTVVEVSTSLCRVDVGGRIRICTLRGSLSAVDTGYTNVVAVGDQVIITPQDADQGVVDTVLPRRSVLARPDVFLRHLQQVIVANADQLLIIASWAEPALWLELVDRYLIAADLNNLQSVICVNKVDLAGNIGACHVALQPYGALGHRVIFASAHAGMGIDELRAVLKDKTTVLAGLSGVGKSSLLSAAQPGLNLRVGAISDRTHMGRHTTTQVNLFKLAMGGCVIDTPGVREFGLSGLHRAELVRYYPEIAAASSRCRFSDCTHQHEPGCAVQTAVRHGRLPEARYHSYTKIYADLPA